MFFVLTIFSHFADFSNHYLYKIYNPSPQIQSKLQHYDVWKSNADSMTVFMPTSAFNELKITNYKILSQNINKMIHKEHNRLKKHKIVPPSHPDLDWFKSFFNEFHNYAEMKQWYLKLSQMYPDLIKFKTIGKSLEQRDLFAIHITSPSQNTTPKKQFYLQSLIHAREWISGSTNAYIAYTLVNEYNNQNSTIINLLDQSEIIFVPIVNPDGYSYTFTHNRMWRKNKNTNGYKSSALWGVDLNRNYQDGFWNETDGASLNPADEDFKGTAPYSEPEALATKEYYESLCCLVGAVDLHSYGQMILRPYGYLPKDCPNEEAFRVVGEQMKDKFMEYGSNYTNEKSIGLYPTSGAASDYFYVGRPDLDWIFSLTIELRPPDDENANEPGFVIDPDQIEPTGEETFAALMIMMAYKLNSTLAE
eukprot:NODE_139_length_16235_cov_0.569038.p6 type:complete len:419 gc:universal NODE_139_length_16235_cov_0.569038:5170-3914(-)